MSDEEDFFGSEIKADLNDVSGIMAPSAPVTDFKRARNFRAFTINTDTDEGKKIVNARFPYSALGSIV